MKNNVSAYKKAAKVCANIIKEKDIEKLDQLSNSLDLHFIKNIGDRENEIQNLKQKELKEARKNIQEIAQKEVTKVQKYKEIFAEAQRIYKGWKTKLELYNKLNRKNNFRG